MAMRAGPTLALATALILTACTNEEGQPQSRPTAPGTSNGAASAASTTASSQATEPRPTETPQSRPPSTNRHPPTDPIFFRQARAMKTVRHLAIDIGPRLATSQAFEQAANWVQRRFSRLGYDTTRQAIRVPAGSSWGVPVDAGTSANVIATPPDFVPGEPWRLVGAHLDTVAVAPGAEDNGSGVAVMLELMRLAAASDTALPTVFVAYGAEEPVGQGEPLHHFGSRLHVDSLPPKQLESLRAMVSLDRVGVSDRGIVPLCTGGLSPPRLRDNLVAVARELGIEASACSDNTSSDHWSYEQRGVTAARVGSTPYAGYHSASDVPGVVEAAQLLRVGRIMWAWLHS